MLEESTIRNFKNLTIPNPSQKVNHTQLQYQTPIKHQSRFQEEKKRRRTFFLISNENITKLSKKSVTQVYRKYTLGTRTIKHTNYKHPSKNEQEKKLNDCLLQKTNPTKF